MQPEDAETLRQGCCNYIGFSDYMSNAVSAQTSSVADPMTGFESVMPNPHFNVSDWGTDRSGRTALCAEYSV